MSDIGLEILLIFFVILANGVFAMCEMAVVTAHKSRFWIGRTMGTSKQMQHWSSLTRPIIFFRP